MSNPAVNPTWIELTIDRSGNELRISARGSRGEHIAARPLGMDRDALLRFAAAVEHAAARGLSLSAAVIHDARAIQRAVLGGEVSALFARLREASAGPLLLRLLLHDNELQAVPSELQAVPWEALCNAGEALGFWGTSPNVQLVRSVASSERWQPGEVRGAVKVLAIAPTGSTGLANLKQALAERIATGEVEWLDPVEGPSAKVLGILERLRREPIPHVLHFLGHGGIDDKGHPALRMGDEDKQEKWLPAEVLAQQLASSFRGVLRLIVLEACEGAKPSVFASAAEILARAGADAVVAHLWEVRADVARTCSTQLYRAMTGANRNTGDIALAMNQTRLAMLATYGSSAEALSPVLYLRAPEGKIFDFQGRKPSSSDPPPVSTFTVGLPIENDADFFGREHEGQRILQALEQRLPVQILGGALTGKSSLLHWVKRHTAAGRPVVWIHAAGISPVMLVAAIARSLGRPEVAKVLDQGANVELAKQKLDALGTFVLLIDEADRLAMGQGHSEDFFQFVRGLIERRQLTWVSASRRDLYDVFKAQGLESRFLNSSTQVWMGPIDKDAAGRLAARGGTHREWMLSEAGGFAYGLQWLGDRLLHDKDLEAVRDAFRREMNRGVFTSWWEGLRPEELRPDLRVVLRQCSDGPVRDRGDSDLREQLNELKDLGYLERSADGYRLVAGAAWQEFVRDAK